MLNGKVNTYITNLINTGALSGADALTIAAASSSTGLNSLQSISSLPPEVQTAVRDAFRISSKWCFLSLVPWSVLSVIATLFLSNIRDRAGKSGGNAEITEKDNTVHVEGPKSDSAA